jgi:hypothetical protein
MIPADRFSDFRLRNLGVISLVALLGCSDGKSTVRGTVTFDGQPVSSGAITFVKKDGELIREGAVITNGAFHATLPPGNYQVELSARRVVGKQKQKGFDGKDEEIELSEELFPARYNTSTTLSAKIDPGANTLKFDIERAR